MNKTMKPVCLLILLSGLAYPVTLHAQNKFINPLTGKREFEFSTYALGSNFSEFGADLIYRHPFGTKFKLGGGLRATFGSLNDYYVKLYPAVLLDAAYFIGQRQKWSINLQPSYSFYTKKESWGESDPVTGVAYSGSSEQKTGLSFQLGANHRSFISPKLQIVAGFFFSLQDIGTKYSRDYPPNPMQVVVNKWNNWNPGGGIRVGIIF
ncbi:MAG TPA: hypothetical protein VIZ28_18850 [Chitinophagaceae bacterium]